MFGHADSIAAWSAHHEHAAARRFLQIDVVDADARAAHRAKVRRLGEQIRRNARGASYDQSVRIGKLVSDRVLGRDHYLQAGRFLEEFHTPLADFVGNDDFHGFPSVFRLQAAPLTGSPTLVSGTNQLKGRNGECQIRRRNGGGRALI